MLPSSGMTDRSPLATQAHTELRGAGSELQELQLALNSVGGTKPFWDQEMVNGVIGENVKVALQRTATRHDDYKIFQNPTPL